MHPSVVSSVVPFRDNFGSYGDWREEKTLLMKLLHSLPWHGCFSKPALQLGANTGLEDTPAGTLLGKKFPDERGFFQEMLLAFPLPSLPRSQWLWCCWWQAETHSFAARRYLCASRGCVGPIPFVPDCFIFFYTKCELDPTKNEFDPGVNLTLMFSV